MMTTQESFIVFILLQCIQQALLLSEDGDDLGVGTDADGPYQSGDGHLSGTVDPDIKNVVGVGLILEPRAPVGDQL